MFFIASLPLITITAFKNIKVGTDSPSYVYFYNKMQSFDAAFKVINEQGEAAFWLLNSLGHLFTSNYFIIFLFCSLIITSCYFYSIRYFNLKTLSLISLLLIGPYYFQLNGTRQAIAIAIFSISVIFLIKRQLFNYVISILIGFLFHKSIIICLPLYFVFKGEIKARKIAIILFFFILLLIFFQTFINIASDIDSRYSSYGAKQDTRGGLVVSTFNVLLFAWFVICRKANAHILATRTFDVLLALYLLGALISILAMVLGVDPSGFLRMSIYFVQMNIFLLPMTIYSFRDDFSRHILIFCAVGFMTIYFYLTTSAFSNLTPYKFNPIIGI